MLTQSHEQFHNLSADAIEAARATGALRSAVFAMG